MSLFDDASLAMIPSAYKDGKLYSIKPTDGSGDFTFSRGSNLAATRVDVNGLIEKGRENLILQSNTFDTTWGINGTGTLTSGQSGYDGSLDAWLLTKSASSTYISQNTTLSAVNTFSVYAKAGTNTHLAFWIRDANQGKYFDLVNGVIESDFVGTPIDAKIESVGNGWYRCSVTTTAADNNCRIYPADADGDTSGTSGSIYIQDAQLEQGLVATDYIETTTTTAQAGILEDMPRLDYSGGASCPSLLLEPQRSNLVLFSEYRQGSDAADFRITTTSNAAISPEGLQNATLFTENTDTNTHFHSIGSVSWVSGTTYTISAYVKSNGRDLHLGVGNPLVIQFTTTYDLTNGIVLSSSASASSIEDAGNGWWRITATATAALSSGTNILPFLYNNATNYAGDGTSGIYVYGFQAEVGSYPTSYIPTYGTSQTRSSDSCVGSFDGDNIFDSNWTAMVEMIAPSQGSTGTSAGFGAKSVEGSISSSDWSFVLAHSIGGLSLKTYNPITDNNIAYNFGDTFKLIVRSDGYYFYNGVKYTLYGLSSNEPVEIGFGRAGQADFSAGETAEIKQVLTFPTALTDSECIALTTL